MGEPARVPVHMVDGDSNFCEANVDRMINSSAELTDPKAPYAVISIVGAQSSGKSYLMNHLFGTKFPVMDARRGRSQTSRGIMISRCIRPSLLLLDVEGFDGIEKGEDTLFEKQSTLFALAVSDLMMVNMNTQDIGRHQGSGKNLFRIIFQERTKLQGAGFTKILVVLRDNTGETPLETLERQILESMQEIWKDVNNKSMKFNDYIEVKVVALPQNMFRAEFQTEVNKLRQLLSNNRSSKVPASGFSLSSSIFWDTIKKNKELDIPSHQEALARLYCRQVVEAIINSLNSQEKYKLLKAKEFPAGFREISHELLEENKAAYDQKAEMYDPDVRSKERQYMVERLHKIFANDSRELIWKVHECTLEEFKAAFYKNIENMKEDDAGLYFEPIVEAYIDKLTSSCEDLKEFDSDYLRMICGELRKKMQLHVALHTREVKVTIATLKCPKLVKDILNSFTSHEKYKLLKDEASPGRFKEISHKLLEEIKTEYDQKAEMYDPDVRSKERQYMVERLHKIFANDSRELIWKVHECTLEEFKGAFYKNIENMKEDDAGLYFEPIVEAYIDKLTSSCEDLKEFDSDYLHMICGELRKKMQLHVALYTREVKETIATLKCPKLVKDILNSFTSHEKYKLLKDEASPGRFKEISHKLLEEIKTEYNLKTKMYDRGIRDQEGQCLEERLHEIIKGESRELIQKVKKSTLQQFKSDYDGKNIQSMNGNEASLYFEGIVDACISKFMSSFDCSCKDEKVFDSEILRRVCGDVEKKLQSYTGQLVKERERKIKAAKDAKNAALIALHSVLAAANTGLAVAAGCLGQLYLVPPFAAAAAASAGQITASAVKLNDKSDSPSTSQDQDRNKSD